MPVSYCATCGLFYYEFRRGRLWSHVLVNPSFLREKSNAEL